MVQAAAAEVQASVMSARQTDVSARVLDPLSIRIFKPDSGFPNLIVHDHACYTRVKIVRCFPLSQAENFISFRDSENREIGLLENLHDLDEDSRNIAKEELEKRYFVSEVTDIYSIRHLHGAVVFDVETNRGRRVFDVHDRHRNIVHLPGGRLFVVDGDGCQYSISDPSSMPTRARGQLYKIL